MHVSGDLGRAHRRDGTLLAAMFLLAFSFALSICARPAWASTADEATRFATEDVIRGGLTIRKAIPLGTSQGDTSVEGTTFDIYAEKGTVLVNGVWFRSIELDGDDAIPCATIVADANGVAATEKDYLPYGTYRIVENDIVDGQNGATLSGGKAWYKVVEVHGDNVVVDAGTVTNPVEKVTVSVQKRDVQRDSAQGGASLAGAVFTVYNRSAAPVEYVKGGQTKVIPKDGVVDTMTTDASGYASLPDGCLDYGTYEAVETTPPTGYNLGDVAWKSGSVECHVEGENKLLGTCSNSVIRGGLTVVKFDRIRDEAVSQGDAKLNAEYTVYSRNAQPVIVGGETYSEGEAVYKGRANEITGVFTIPTNMLPYGAYEVRETAAPYGYLIDEDWSYNFNITGEGQVARPSEEQTNKNEPVSGGIRVLKVDADTGESAPQGNGDLANIVIDIYNESARSIVFDGHEYAPGEKVMSITTKATSNGFIAETGARDLPLGRYSLRESSVPESSGYLRNLGWNPTVEIKADGEIAEAIIPNEG